MSSDLTWTEVFCRLSPFAINIAMQYCNLFEWGSFLKLGYSFGASIAKTCCCISKAVLKSSKVSVRKPQHRKRNVLMFCIL